MHRVSRSLNAGDHTEETLEGVPGVQDTRVWCTVVVRLTHPLRCRVRVWLGSRPSCFLELICSKSLLTFAKEMKA